MRVVTIAGVAPRKMGSFEKFLRDYSYYLSEEGVEHTIIVPAYPIPKVSESLASAGAKIVVFEDVFSKNLGACLRLYRLILTEKPTILHIHFLPIVGFLSFIMLFNKIKLFATYHISGSCNKNTILIQIYKKLRWLILGQSYNEIFCVSEYNKKKFINDYSAPEAQVSVVYNAINQTEFSNYRNNSLASLPKKDSRLNLISVAALIPEKGIQYLIEACAELSAMNIDYQLDIVGEGPYQKNLEDLARSLNISSNVKFLGSRNDVPELLLNGDIMIAPSVWEEAFGYTILEAMSIGIPLIVSRAGGIPELVEHNFNGLVIEKSSSNSITRAIVTLVNQPELRQQFSSRGISKSLEKFSIDEQCRKLFSSYQKYI